MHAIMEYIYNLMRLFEEWQGYSITHSSSLEMQGSNNLNSLVFLDCTLSLDELLLQRQGSVDISIRVGPGKVSSLCGGDRPPLYFKR